EVVLESMQRGYVGASIGNRLLQLLDIAGDEYPETEIPGLQMLTSVLGFFRGRRDILPPLLTLTSTGNVWAQWTGSQNRMAALEFKRDGSVNLAAFFPDSDEPLRQASIASNMSWKAASREIRNNANL